MRRILVSSVLLVAACATSPDAAAMRRYMCADGTAFFARYGKGGVVLDFGNGRSTALSVRPGGTPGGYAQGDDAFQVRDAGEANLIRAGRPPVSCRRGDVRDLALIP